MLSPDAVVVVVVDTVADAVSTLARRGENRGCVARISEIELGDTNSATGGFLKSS